MTDMWRFNFNVLSSAVTNAMFLDIWLFEYEEYMYTGNFKIWLKSFEGQYEDIMVFILWHEFTR